MNGVRTEFLSVITIIKVDLSCIRAKVKGGLNLAFCFF